MPYCVNVFQNDVRAAVHLLKIDPSKESWGDIKLNVVVKRPKISGSQTSAAWGSVGNALRVVTNIQAAHNMGTGFVKSSQIGESRRGGILLTQVEDNTLNKDTNSQGKDSDKAAKSDNNSCGNINDFDDLDGPVICVHCDLVNKGTSIYCSNPTCGKVLT